MAKPKSTQGKPPKILPNLSDQALLRVALGLFVIGALWWLMTPASSGRRSGPTSAPLYRIRVHGSIHGPKDSSKGARAHLHIGEIPLDHFVSTEHFLSEDGRRFDIETKVRLNRVPKFCDLTIHTSAGLTKLPHLALEQMPSETPDQTELVASVSDLPLGHGKPTQDPTHFVTLSSPPIKPHRNDVPPKLSRVVSPPPIYRK